MPRRLAALVLAFVCLTLTTGWSSPSLAASTLGATCQSDPQCDAGQTCQDKDASSQIGTCKASTNAPATAEGCEDGKTCLINPLKVKTVPELASNVISTAVGIVGAISLLIFIYGGLRWLTSAGEPAKIQEGKDAMKWAAIGLVVIFSSYTLVNFVFNAFKG